MLLKVGEPYSFNVWGQSSGEGKLVSAIVESLSGNDGNPPLPSMVTLPMLKERYAKDPKHNKWLLWHALVGVQAGDDELSPLLVELAGAGDANLRGAALEGLVKFDQELKAEVTRKALAKNLGEDDMTVAMNAASALLDVDASRGFGRGGGRRSDGRSEAELRTLAPELLPQLFHENMDVRKHVRRILSYASDEQLGDLPKVLASIAIDPATPVRVGDVQLFDESGSEKDQELRRLAAIRTLAVLGPRVKDHWKEVAEQMKSEDYEVKIAAYVAVLRMFGVEQYNRYPLSRNNAPEEFITQADRDFQLYREGDELDKYAATELVTAVGREQEVLGASTGDHTGGGFF